MVSTTLVISSALACMCHLVSSISVWILQISSRSFVTSSSFPSWFLTCLIRCSVSIWCASRSRKLDLLLRSFRCLSCFFFAVPRSRNDSGSWLICLLLLHPMMIQFKRQRAECYSARDNKMGHNSNKYRIYPPLLATDVRSADVGLCRGLGLVGWLCR